MVGSSSVHRFAAPFERPFAEVVPDMKKPSMTDMQRLAGSIPRSKLTMGMAMGWKMPKWIKMVVLIQNRHAFVQASRVVFGSFFCV